MRRELILYKIIINNFSTTTQIKLMKLRLMIRYLQDILKKKSKRFKIKKFTIINLIKKNKNKIEKRLKTLKKTKSSKIKEINLIEKSNKNKNKVKETNKNEIEKFDKNKNKSKIKKTNKNEIEKTKSKKVKKLKIIILSKVFLRIIEFYEYLCALCAFDFTTLMQINVFEEIKKSYKVSLIKEVINKMKNDLYKKNYDKLNFETYIITRKNIKQLILNIKIKTFKNDM